MSRQPPSPESPPHYSPDGRWYWDGSRWLAVPATLMPPLSTGPGERGGIGSPSWAPPPAPTPSPPVEASDPAVATTPRARAGRPVRAYLAGLATALVALLVLGGVGSGVVIAIHNRQTGIPRSAPSAQAIFELPFTKGVRSARFHRVTHAQGSTWTGSGVIDFAPQHAFSESLVSSGGDVFERDVETGGFAYSRLAGMSRYQATVYEATDFHSLGWDGDPAPTQLELTGQTSLDGQQAWVLKQADSSNRWVIGEGTGDPLKVMLDGHDTYTFSDWGRAPAIRAPARGDVSTARYAGSAGAPVVAPAATVTVGGAQVDSSAGSGDPPGFRSVALEITYRNTTSAASEFDDSLSLVSSAGLFAPAIYTSLSPALQPGTVAPGQAVTGWADFTVPRQATRFHLLFGEQLDQIPSLDYLISISVEVPN